MAKQAAKSTDNTTRWIVIAMVSLVIVTGVVFSLFSQNTKESASLAGLDGIKPMPAITSTIDTANGSAITFDNGAVTTIDCLLYTSPSPRDRQKSRMPSSA